MAAYGVRHGGDGGRGSGPGETAPGDGGQGSGPGVRPRGTVQMKISGGSHTPPRYT